MKQFALLITLFICLNSFGNPPVHSNISRKVEKIVARIERTNELMGSTVSRAAIRPEQYDRFLELRQKATPMELVVLTNHRNGVVRCYALWALTYLPFVDLSPIVQYHAHETTVVKTFFDCFTSEQTVGSFFQNMTAKNLQ